MRKQQYNKILKRYSKIELVDYSNMIDLITANNGIVDYWE